jgi:hypothetical protein
MDSPKAFTKVAQSLARGTERGTVSIDADDASFGRGFKDRFTVSAEADSAVDKETSSLRSEEMHRFS